MTNSIDGPQPGPNRPLGIGLMRVTGLIQKDQQIKVPLILDDGNPVEVFTIDGAGLTTPLIYQTGPKTSAKSGWSCSMREKHCISGRSLASGIMGIRS